MNSEKPIGWAELDALQALARGASLEMMRKPLTALTHALDLGGYKFCIASPEIDGFRIIAVIAGGDLTAAPDGFLNTKIEPTDPILWESYRSVTPVSWTPYFTNDVQMEASGVSGLAARGVTAGASIPIISQHKNCRASLCVSGARNEPPGSLDLRLPAFWPLLRLAGLALLEAGVAEAERSGRTRFTPSENEVLKALSRGLRVKEVALELGKSERTIRNQIESARVRAGATTTIEMIVKWQREVL
ncbi:MAG: helix-turn-helix transcriptional regulator [Pseudomonadota bacterium]